MLAADNNQLALFDQLLVTRLSTFDLLNLYWQLDGDHEIKKALRRVSQGKVASQSIQCYKACDFSNTWSI